MAQEISNNFRDSLEDTNCKQLLTFVVVYWSSGAIVYSEQEILFDQDLEQWSFPALLSLGAFDVSLKLNNNGTALNFSVSLDDSDGHLKLRFDREPLSGLRVDLLLNFSHLSVVDALLIGVGTINSDSIQWEENDRILNFNVENVISSKKVAYKAYPEMIAGQEDIVPSKYFPFVFGSPRRFPALRIQGGRSALTTHMRPFVGTPAVGSQAFKTAYLLDKNLGFELDTSLPVAFFDVLQIENAPEGHDGATGQVIKIQNGGLMFVPDGVVAELTDVVLQPFNMADPDGVYPTGTSFDSFRYWWVNLDPALPAENMLNQYIDFDDWDDRPSKITCKVLEHIETPASSGFFRIKIDHEPRWGKQHSERDPSKGNSYKDWFCNIMVDISDGTFSPTLKIRARANYAMYSWKNVILAYTQILVDGSKKDEISDPNTIQEWLPVTDPSATPSLVVDYDITSDNPDLKYFVSTFSPEDKDKTLDTATNFIWALPDDKDARGFEDKVTQLSLVGDPALIIAVMIPDENFRNASLYISNIFTAGVTQSAPPDIQVFAESNVVGGIIPVATAIITVDHQALIPRENQLLTTIQIDPPLEYTGVEGYYSGEVFVDHTAAYLAHDGFGGVVDLDTENAVDVIAWLFSVYSDLDVHVDQKDFLDTRAKVAGSRMAFGIAEEIDAISLANILAWEHKLALVFFSNSVKIVDLNKTPVIKFEFTNENIELRSLKLSFIPTNQIITDFRFRFSSDKDGGDGEVIVFNNNVRRYGKNTQFINVLSLDNEEDVFELVKFWGNRLSRSWRTVEFKASIEAITLQPFDGITIDVPAISENAIVGFVDSVRYEPNSFTVTVKCTLASEATKTAGNTPPTTDASYWEGLKDLRLEGDKRVSLVSELEGAKLQAFSLTDLNTLKPFERRL